MYNFKNRIYAVYMVKEMNIAQKIKAYRKFKGLTQETVASKAGLNEKYYGRIERGESCPTIDSINKICLALEIDISELLLFEENNGDMKFRRNPRITRAIINGLKNDIDIHFNRNIIFNGCESSIWYNGYIGSMNFDEFELQLFAVGNIKGILYKEGDVLLELNSEDVTNELKKYITDDKELSSLIEYMPFDQKVLEDKSGNAFFVTETNWLMARLIDNNSGTLIQDEIILDTDNVIEGLSNKDMLFDYIF